MLHSLLSYKIHYAPYPFVGTTWTVTKNMPLDTSFCYWKSLLPAKVRTLFLPLPSNHM